MNTLRHLRILPIWVNPQHLVSTAAHILAGHKVKALGVLDDSRLVGTVGIEEILRAPEGATVGAVMRPVLFQLDVTTPIREAAGLIADQNLDYTCVLDGDRFVGILTPNMLLREMERSYDPLTGLSWSDQLREWGLVHLELGDEVTILFIDLNDFGQYNKRHGHIIGDKVIRLIAEKLGECVDRERDILVRYGGDEFAIGTLRHRAEAEVLCELIRRRVNGMSIEAGVEPVTFSIGLFGGRRTREREDTHYAATLDNLINMASRAALAAKTASKKGDDRAVVRTSAASGHESAYRVVGVYPDDQGARPVTTVILGFDDTIVSGAAAQAGVSQLEAAAMAAAKAVERTRPEVNLKLETLSIEEGTVRLKARVNRGDESSLVTVSRRIANDPLVAAAEATVEALVGRD